MNVVIDIYKIKDMDDLEEVASDRSIKYVEIGDQTYRVKRKDSGVFIPGVNVEAVRDWIREIEEARKEQDAIYNCLKGCKQLYDEFCEDCKLPIIEKTENTANIILSY